MFTKKQLNQFYQYAYSLTSDRDEAYDILQAGLEKFLHHQNQVQNPQAWMIKVMRNLFLDECKRHQPELVDINDSRLMSMTDELDSLEDLVMDKDLIEQLWGVLGSNEREILYFWAILGCTSTEIADSLNAPRGTIVSRIHRIKAKLQHNESTKFKRAL